MKWQNYLNSIYYDPKHPASFSGPQKLLKNAKKDGYEINLSQIEKWLKGNETYTLHRPVRRKFKRNKVYVPRIDHQWDADLMDMSRISDENDGYHYVLLAIDIFSRYVWTVPLKTKQSSEVANGLKSIFDQGRKPLYLRTDKGTEFIGYKTQILLKRYNVFHFVTQNEEIKANYAERAIKTIKMKIYKYFTFKQTYKYIDELQNFTYSYNHTRHRIIKRAPVTVNKGNEQAVHDLQYYGESYDDKKEKKFRFNVGDVVRISHKKKPFTREYQEKWSGELFIIKERFKRDGLAIYKLMDYDKEEITGTFYEPEIQGATPNDSFKIEKVLKTRKRKGQSKEYLVRWLRWPPKFDSWVSEKDMV